MNGFFESIRVENGQAVRLAYHQARVDRTLAAWNGVRFELGDLPILRQLPGEGLFKLRVAYGLKGVISVELLPYEPLLIKRIGIIEIPQSVEYLYKWADRQALHQLLADRPGLDELLLIKEGLLTDSIIGNVALEMEGRWLTPAKPLLPGTYRQYLLDERQIETADLGVEDVFASERIAVINAMRGLELAVRLVDVEIIEVT